MAHRSVKVQEVSSEDAEEFSYYKKPPKEILRDIEQLNFSNNEKIIEIKHIKMILSPHVYPSDRFRTTNFLLESLEPFLKDARVCDMGCGLGVVGLYAIVKGAKKVVQADINTFAVDNAKKNRTLHKISDKKLEIYQSDCFDKMPPQKFDVIIFNPPFHSDFINIKDPLEHAFFDPSFQTVKKFLNQVAPYSLKRHTRIFLAFSNKGNVDELELIFKSSSFDWKLWKIINQDKEFDNRIYLLRKF